MPNSGKNTAPPLCDDCCIGQFAVYAPAFKEDASEILNLRRRTAIFPPKSMLLREGDVPTEVFTILEGWAFRFTLMSDGRRQILSYLLPGDLVTYQALNDLPVQFSVQALTDVSVCAFDLGAFKDFIGRHSAVARNFAIACCREASFADTRIADLGRRSALERVASLVRTLESRLRSRGVDTGRPFRFPLRQEHIADTLGLSPVHVSRTLTALRDDDIVDVFRGMARVGNRTRLDELLGFASSPPRHFEETE